MTASTPFNTLAVVLEEPQRLALGRLDLTPPGDDDVVVDIEFSGISTGTERLLWSGRMPPFPGMGYPLVPGYESVGRVCDAGSGAKARIGERVFVPGANCFGPVRGLFGGAAAKLVVPSRRVVRVDEGLGEHAVLLALAATAQHAIAGGQSGNPELVIGHGVLGRLLARLSAIDGTPVTVWELDASRREGASGYRVCDPADDTRNDYRVICDVSGDSAILDTLIPRLRPGGEIVIAGFYSEPLSFKFAPAFMREARLRVAAQWQPADLEVVLEHLRAGRLSLDGLITHRRPAEEAQDAYRTAFDDPACLKMVLDWRSCS
jgi:3-hydroxyethyl bacteriochlorophyllide a dehydrogenase